MNSATLNMIRTVTIPTLFVIFLFKLSSCGDTGQDEDYISKNAPGCARSDNGIPCGDIFSADLLTVHEHATIDALRDYLIAKKNVRSTSPFRQVDGDGKGDREDLLRGVRIVRDLYGINPIFAVSLSALESKWGQSYLARTRYNLWGWNAVDGKEWKASRFKSFSAGFKYVFSRIQEWYFFKDGKYHRQCKPLEHFKTYVRRGGCSARHCGITLAGMNCKYSSDPKWAYKIRLQMNHITRFINKRCQSLPPFPEITSIVGRLTQFHSQQHICAQVVQ